MPATTLQFLLDHQGQSLGRSPWFEITQQRIQDFADCTLDHQWIHVDLVASQKGPFGAPIAHGFLVLSLVPHLLKDLPLVPEPLKMMMNYGCDRVRFISPFRSGCSIRAHVTLQSMQEKQPSQWLLKAEVRVEIQGESKPGLIAECLSLFVV